MRTLRFGSIAFLLALLSPAASDAQSRPAIARAVDSIVGAALAGGRAAGMAVAVVQGNGTFMNGGNYFTILRSGGTIRVRADRGSLVAVLSRKSERARYSLRIDQIGSTIDARRAGR